MRNQLSFCISKLRHGEQITLGGLGQNLCKVIVMTEILKERVGWLHQISNFTTKQNTSEEKNSEGKKRGRV